MERKNARKQGMNEDAASSLFLWRVCVNRLPAISCLDQLDAQAEAFKTTPLPTPMHNGSEMSESE